MSKFESLDRIEYKWISQFFYSCLKLDNLTSISSAQALALTTFQGDHLSLGGLKYISTSVAESLSSFSGRHLSLDGITSLSDSAGFSLASFKGDSISLCGLRSLSDSTALSLRTFKGHSLSLGGLTFLSDSASLSIASFKGQFLSLDGLTSLSDSVALSLASFKGHSLSLGGLTSLSVSAALSLASFEGASLSLDGLTSLSESVVLALASFKGPYISLNGLKSLSDSVAMSLACFRKYSLSLDGLTSLSDSAAKSLASFKGQVLYLNGLTSITDIAMWTLASSFSKNFDFDGNNYCGGVYLSSQISFPITAIGSESILENCFSFKRTSLSYSAFPATASHLQLNEDLRTSISKILINSRISNIRNWALKHFIPELAANRKEVALQFLEHCDFSSILEAPNILESLLGSQLDENEVGSLLWSRLIDLYSQDDELSFGRNKLSTITFLLDKRYMPSASLLSKTFFTSSERFVFNVSELCCRFLHDEDYVELDAVISRLIHMGFPKIDILKLEQWLIEEITLRRHDTNNFKNFLDLRSNIQSLVCNQCDESK